MEYGSDTALVVVDVQNDFADPAGSLFVDDAPGSLQFVNQQVAEAVAAGSTVAYTRDWHPPSTPHFVTEGGIWPVHCVAGTWGAEFHPDLTVAEAAIHIRKGTGREDGYSGFSGHDAATGDATVTELHGLLGERGVQRVAVVGLALDYCVRATAIDAAERGYATTVLADGTRPVNLAPGDAARAVADMVQAGVKII